MSNGVPQAPGAAPQITNYLWQAIVVTILCCLPFGIPAIVYATQVNSKLAAGDVAGAQVSSSKAKFWCWMAFGFGLAAYVIGMLVYGTAFFALIGAARQSSGQP